MFEDLKRHFKSTHLNYQSKYTDSLIGVFWIPLSSLFLIAVLVAIFGSSRSEELWQYAAYITVGYIVWGFVADTINNHNDVFRAKRNEFSSPGSTVADVFFKTLVERLYLFSINFLCLSFLFVPGALSNWEQLSFFPLALVLLIIASVSICYIFSIFTLYFPDFKRIVGNFTRVLFFASPIFWGHGGVTGGARTVFYTYNPVTYFLEVVRYSLGIPVSMEVDTLYLVASAISFGIAMFAFMLYRLTPAYARNIQ